MWLEKPDMIAFVSSLCQHSKRPPFQASIPLTARLALTTLLISRWCKNFKSTSSEDRLLTYFLCAADSISFFSWNAKLDDITCIFLSSTPQDLQEGSVEI